MRYLWLAALVLAHPVPGLAADNKDAQAVKQGLEHARLELQTGKRRYLPGEGLTLRVRIINTSRTPIHIDDSSDVRHGLLKVFIAQGDGPFKEYVGPQWGTLDVAHSGVVEIAPDRPHELEVSLLYNHRPETKHLSAAYAKQLLGKRVATAYALAEPGTYQLKAVLYDPFFSGSIESPPVKITVEPPRGADLEVWKELESHPEYGYFIQMGGPAGPPESAKSRAQVEALQRLAAAYPGSRYAESIRSSLSRYHRVLEQLKAHRPSGKQQ